MYSRCKKTHLLATIAILPDRRIVKRFQLLPRVPNHIVTLCRQLIRVGVSNHLAQSVVQVVHRVVVAGVKQILEFVVTNALFRGRLRRIRGTWRHLR